MTHRIFVNAGNELYKQITENGKGAQYGLGNASDLGTNIGNELGKRSGEIFFYADDLRDKRRRLQLGLENLTNPTMFIDGLLDAKLIESTIKQYQANFIAGKHIDNKFFRLALTCVLINSGIVLSAALVTVGFTATALGLGTILTTSATGAFAAGNIVSAALASGPVGWIALAVGAAIAYVFGDWIGDHVKAGAEDDAQRWTFNRRDFPTINGNVFPDKYRRSIRRLYDDRAGITKNFDDNETIARLTREILSDIFYSKNGVVQPGHPGEGNYDAQANLFPFKKNTAGPNYTYIDAIFYISSYIGLIDAILSLNDPGLSRSPDTEEATFSTKINISLTTAKVRLYNALAINAEQVIAEKFLTFLDDSKEYKTLLNFGNDTQYSAESWRIAPTSTSSIQLKLFTPLNETTQVYDRAFLSREVAKSVIDTVEFQLSDEVDFSPSLRPRNTSIEKYTSTKKSINNVTLNSLDLAEGSAGTFGNTEGVPVSYEDKVFRKWYTSNFNQSELNIDFSDYNNFVVFGSAKSRLDAFVTKLTNIENLDNKIKGSVIGDALKAQEKESIIRSFDAYEQYLYYSSGSSYSASAYYVDEGVEYNLTGSWPRSGSTLLSTTSSVATNWYATQSGIAERFDEYNQNNLTRHLPIYIQEDQTSADFLTFVKMFGHIIDDVKIYIDQFPNIYSTSPDPFEELTMDQVYEVATSFGLKLPNVYALETLQQYVSSIYNGEDSRSLVAETWKRFLHMMMFMYKSKGTKTSFETILNGYGINTPALQIKETSYPTADNFIASEELTYGLKFSSQSASYLQIPNVSSSFTTKTLSVRFLPTTITTSSLLTGDDLWAVNIVPHPSASTVPVVKNYGRIEIISGSNNTLIASSSYFLLFGDDYTTLTLRSESADFTVTQADSSQILYQYSGSNNITNTLWNSTLNIYIGGSGSIKSNTNFNGIVDEVRAWNENISNDNIAKQAYDPGGMYGNTYTSPKDYLYVNLTFSQPLTSITQSAYNESPFIQTEIPAVGFATSSYIRITRPTRQYVPVIGATVYSNKKITVAPPPIFNDKFVDQHGTKLLNTKTSIKSAEEKRYTDALNIVSLAVSPTDFINQNITRTMGNIAINTIIGNPRDLKNNIYSELDTLFKYYKLNYNKEVNPNEYIDFYKNLAEAPSEIAKEYSPARSKLLNGVVIESPILSRKKLNLNRNVQIGGSDTKALDSYISGSGPSDTIGVFAANVEYDMQQTIAVTSENILFEGNVDDIIEVPVGDYLYYENEGIDGSPRYTASAGYARFAFSEELINTPEQPFYDIPPRSDLLDYGTTTYFHKSNGIYPFQLLTQYKQIYLAALDIKPFWAYSPVYSKITLLPVDSSLTTPGRDLVEFGQYTYEPGQIVEGFVNTATIYSLLGIEGSAGLRVQLYVNSTYRSADPTSRPVEIPPVGTHGVLFDGVLTEIADVTPPVLIQTENSTTYFRITNTTTDRIVSNIGLNYFAYEIEPLIPSGYLPRHYRFTRENITSLKRRNYLGCKATLVDNVTDPLGRVGNSNSFYTITSDYNSIDVVGKADGVQTKPRIR